MVTIFVVELAISSLSLCSNHALASATCLLLRVSHTAPAVQIVALVQRDHHSALQLLLFTVVTVVVTGTLCIFTVSLSLSLFAPVLASGPVVHLQALFRVKDGLRRRPTHSLHTAFTAAPDTAHLASRTSSCKFTLHSAMARRIGDVASKRLEHPPLASVCVLLTDRSRVPPSAWTSTMRRFSCASRSSHTTRIAALHFLCTAKTHAGTWASELVLGTRVASVILHGCSTVASAARSVHGVVSIGASVPVFKRGIVLVDTGFTLRRLLLSSSSEDQRSRPPLRNNSFVLLCPLSLTTAVCVTRLADDHQMSPMMIQPTSTQINLLRNRLLPR